MSDFIKHEDCVYEHDDFRGGCSSDDDVEDVSLGSFHNGCVSWDTNHSDEDPFSGEHLALEKPDSRWSNVAQRNVGLFLVPNSHQLQT
jgi:hypothetical protein